MSLHKHVGDSCDLNTTLWFSMDVLRIHQPSNPTSTLLGGWMHGEPISLVQSNKQHYHSGLSATNSQN